MNSDLVNTQNLLLWLLLAFDPTFSIPSGNGSTSEATTIVADSFGVGSDATSSKPIDQKGQPLTPPGAAINPSTCSRVVSFQSFWAAHRTRFSMASRDASVQKMLSQTAQSFNFGEIHAVQDRFHALLKQRLLSEYENRPPLFPWESEMTEYPAEVSETVGALIAAPTPLWATHMSALKVSGLLPQPLLNALFARCQALVSAPIKQGVRLVRAVEDSFPDQSDLLEPIADLVLVPAYRSADTSTQAALTQELAAVAGEYDSALPEQQIALSMLAAQEILGALTLSVSNNQPRASRQWLTTLGTLELSAHYTPEQLTLSAVLPDGGQVRLWDGDLEKRALRSQPGSLDLMLANPGFDRTYLIQVSLQGEENPLNFAVHLGDA